MRSLKRLSRFATPHCNVRAATVGAHHCSPAQSPNYVPRNVRLRSARSGTASTWIAHRGVLAAMSLRLHSRDRGRTYRPGKGTGTPGPSIVSGLSAAFPRHLADLPVRGCAVLIAGGPGIGKTAPADQFRPHAVRDGVRDTLGGSRVRARIVGVLAHHERRLPRVRPPAHPGRSGRIRGRVKLRRDVPRRGVATGEAERSPGLELVVAAVTGMTTAAMSPAAVASAGVAYRAECPARRSTRSDFLDPSSC
jgi:hypothetical protein